MCSHCNNPSDVHSVGSGPFVEGIVWIVLFGLIFAVCFL